MKPEITSCGFLIYRTDPTRSFLLMKHPDRWDLPKGHVDPGESEIECALRELEEETGIRKGQINRDSEFRFTSQYTVQYKRHGNIPKQKQLIIFLAELTEPVKLVLTEHQGWEWVQWNPPHDIQENTINPLLAAVDRHWEGRNESADKEKNTDDRQE